MRTPRLPASALLACLAITGLVGCSASADPDPSTIEATESDTTDLAPEIELTLEALVDSGATAAVMDVRNGDDHSQGAAGLRGLDGADEASPDDTLRIASITKTMTATVILQLVESGDLRLDTVVDDVIPGLLDSPAPVTIEQLMNHTSGLPDYFAVLAPDAGAYLATTDEQYTARQLAAAAQTLPWVAAPGERFSYANTNYAVLGLIAETTTGDTMPELLQARVFEPVGMEHTEYPQTAALPEGALRGVVDIDGVPTDTGDASPSLWNAAAALTSTVGDVGAFFSALFGGELLSPASVSAMQEIGVEGYGLGVLAGGDACGVMPPDLVFGQRGNGVGYRVLALGSPDGSRFVVLGWTGGTFDPAVDPLLEPANTALIAGLHSTCP